EENRGQYGDDNHNNGKGHGLAPGRPGDVDQLPSRIFDVVYESIHIDVTCYELVE
ncbi:MAG: hypothetical protein UY54_C0030G0001, partial [Parcubacteria group bacterium GW2011_GWA2_50_10b]